MKMLEDKTICIDYEKEAMKADIQRQWYEQLSKTFRYKSPEETMCEKYFGGMSIEDIQSILKQHAPEYFI